VLIAAEGTTDNSGRARRTGSGRHDEPAREGRDRLGKARRTGSGRARLQSCRKATVVSLALASAGVRGFGRPRCFAMRSVFGWRGGFAMRNEFGWRQRFCNAQRVWVAQRFTAAISRLERARLQPLRGARQIRFFRTAESCRKATGVECSLPMPHPCRILCGKDEDFDTRLIACRTPRCS
jgi:hypothetical protein